MMKNTPDEKPNHLALVETKPKDLSPRQLAALRIAHEYRLRRVNGGWFCPGARLITVSIASGLMARGLVKQRTIGGKWRLDVTPEGKNLLAEASARAKPKGGTQ